MNEHRKRARDYLKSIKTLDEFNNYLDSLTLKEEEKQIAKDIYIHGLSHTQIAMRYNMTIEKSHRVIQKILDKVL